MNMFSRMNLRRRAPFSYLAFCIYSPVWSKKLLNSLWIHIWSKFVAKSYLLMAKAVTNSLPHRPPFFSVFKKWLCEVYRRFGTETSPVVSLNYLLPMGKSWWRCFLCCAVSCGHLLRCSRWIWSRRSRSRGNTVCSVTSLTLRYIVGKIGRLSLQLAKTARDDIINSIRGNV